MVASKLTWNDDQANKTIDTTDYRCPWQMSSVQYLLFQLVKPQKSSMLTFSMKWLIPDRNHLSGGGGCQKVVVLCQLDERL